MQAPKPGGREFQGTQRFQVQRCLGAGGMGMVYEVFDAERHETVALKTLRTMGAQALLRFKNEFRALQDVQHPNLVSLSELLEEDGEWFFTMELVKGVDFIRYVWADAAATPTTLSEENTTDWLDKPTLQVEVPEVGAKKKPFSPSPLPIRAMACREDRLRATLAQLALGVAALHRAHKVHRDIKPSNILVTEEGRVVLLDFGLITDISESSAENSIVGTSHFMAPEQAARRPVGPEADWYSVGVVLYLAVAGRPPFRGRGEEVIYQKQHFEPIAPGAFTSGIPADLDQLSVDLLRMDPTRRPSGSDVLRRVGARVSEAQGPGFDSRATPFVGRGVELAELRQAFEDSRVGKSVTVIVSGESGVGKSALVRQFHEGLVDGGRATVLAGRCYERESVPYKAVDEVVDALSRLLLNLPRKEAREFLPPQFALLCRIFPVLVPVAEKLGGSSEGRAVDPADLEPRQLRTHAFAALRELLRRLSARQPLVLSIDDLQWADGDSLALISEVMRPPDPSPLLLLATLRISSITGTRDSIDPRARLPGDVRTIDVGCLPMKEAQQLVVMLAAGSPPVPGFDAAAIAHEAAGHPLFIDALFRHRSVGGAGSHQVIRLDDAMWARVERLSTPARELLEALVVAATPLPQGVASLASSLDYSEFVKAATILRGENLVRTGGVHRSDTIEVYHDRVRESVSARLDSSARRHWHHRLAVVLEASGDADPETLSIHWRAAGDLERAATHAETAAGRAAQALAFDRAAQLYRVCLELRTGSADESRPLLVLLAGALVNANRGVEAGETYLSAAVGAAPMLALDLRRRAADQLLKAGRFDEGIAALGEVLKQVGLEIPKTPQRALASLLFHRAKMRLRGVGFRLRAVEQISAEDLLRLDVCCAGANGLCLTDVVRGADFQTRWLLLALRAGEPGRLARALAIEAIYAAMSGVRNLPRAERLRAMASTLASQSGQPAIIGTVLGCAGWLAAQSGSFQQGRDLLEEGLVVLRKQAVGVSWEMASGNVFLLWCLNYLGDTSELERVGPRMVAEAEELGDLFSVTTLKVGPLSQLWLAKDDPQRVHGEVDEAIRRWSQRGFHMQHQYALRSHLDADLYAGEGARAHERILSSWAALTGSKLLLIQILRLQVIQARGLAALSAAVMRPAQVRAPLIAAALRDARRIERERVGWFNAQAAILRGSAATLKGQQEEAVTWFNRAATGLDRYGMAIHAASVRLRLGQLLGGDEGAKLAADARGSLADRAMNPERMSLTVLPSLS